MEKLEQFFEDCKSERIKILIEEYENRIEMASDKLYSIQTIINEKQEEFNKVFTNYRLELKWHIDKSMKLNKHLTFDKTVRDYFNGQPIKKTKIALKEYGDFTGWMQFLDKLRQDSIRLNPEIENELESDHDYLIQWSKNFTQRNFIKIIYALHYAGFIKNSEGQITHLVEEIARRLDFELGKNWQSNVSKGKDYINNDFDSYKIFDELKNAYIDKSKD